MGEKIKLPRGIGIIVAEQLKSHGINIWERSKGLLPDFSFTQEELSLITKIELKNPSAGQLEGVENLPNLTSLTISYDKDTTITDPRDISSIDDSDMKSIGKCTSLKNLSISNQAKITYVDVSRLTQLEFLSITNNEHLEDISGLERLHGLYEFRCKGNNRLYSIKGLDEVILSNPNMYEMGIDVLLFPDAIGYNHVTGEYNKEALKRIQGMSRVTWEEKLTETKDTKINTYQMIQLHNKCCQILDENISPSADKRDTIIGIELYLAQNVKYDSKGKEHGYTHVLDPVILPNGQKVYLQDGPTNGTNGAYNAIIKNSCICEGYTRAMQYLLKLKGIHSHNVSCFATPDKTYMSKNGIENQHTRYRLPGSGYHSIICIDDFFGYYADPCINATLYQKGDKSLRWALCTKEEMSKTHTLSFDERGIENDHLQLPNSAIEDSIRHNNLFAGTRREQVEGVRGQVRRIKGQITKGEE